MGQCTSRGAAHQKEGEYGGGSTGAGDYTRRRQGSFAILKQQRCRFYIARKCVVLLICYGREPSPWRNNKADNAWQLIAATFVGVGVFPGKWVVNSSFVALNRFTWSLFVGPYGPLNGCIGARLSP